MLTPAGTFSSRASVRTRYHYSVFALCCTTIAEDVRRLSETLNLRNISITAEFCGSPVVVSFDLLGLLLCGCQ